MDRAAGRESQQSRRRAQGAIAEAAHDLFVVILMAARNELADPREQRGDRQTRILRFLSSERWRSLGSAASATCLSMILSENRFTLFRIMLQN